MLICGSEQTLWRSHVSLNGCSFLCLLLENFEVLSKQMSTLLLLSVFYWCIRSVRTAGATPLTYDSNSAYGKSCTISRNGFAEGKLEVLLYNLVSLKLNRIIREFGISNFWYRNNSYCFSLAFFDSDKLLPFIFGDQYLFSYQQKFILQ